jgi:hypothetical protein
MGDEITYLQGELNTIAGQVAESYPGAEQRWSLVVYRDYAQEEEYLVRVNPFSAPTLATISHYAEDYRAHPRTTARSVCGLANT